MTMRTSLWAWVGLVLVLWTGVAVGQVKPACDPQQSTVATPEKVEGKVVKVDAAISKVIVQDRNGRTYEFHASPEILRDIKLGEPIEAKLRPSPSC